VSAPIANVTAIVPAYNAEHTILEAIASIDAQSVRPREIIVIDDASRDATPRLLQHHLGRRPDCRLILQERNTGPAAARNAAIAHAQTEWLAFLDGDDAWLPHRLSSQLALAARHPAVALWCGAVVPLVPSAASAPEPMPPEGPPFRDIPLAEFAAHNAVATSTVLVRRAALLDVGGFDPQFVGPEDYDLWMRLAARQRLARIECPLSRYRLVVGSLSMDDRRFLPQVLRVLDKGFAPGGALCDLADRRAASVATQYWNASWMAFNRGARAAALQYWWAAYRMDHRSAEAASRPWWKLLARYVVGRPESAGTATLAEGD
jgi:hypothetical protein